MEATGYTPDGVSPLLALVTYYGEACEDGDDERTADLYGQIAAWLRANQLAPKVDYTPNEIIDLAMRWRDAWAKADREDTRQAWDEANKMLDWLRVVISGLLRQVGDALPEGMEFRPAAVWVCGARPTDPCTSSNPHRSRSCGWRPAQTPEEPTRG